MGNRHSLERQQDALMRDPAANEASFELKGRHFHLESHVSISTSGLAAIGSMVTGILLSSAVIVWVSTRKLPKGTLPRDLKA